MSQTQTWDEHTGLIGRPAFNFNDSESRPHWMRYGTGTCNLAVEVEAGGGLHFETTEIAEGKRAGKEAWACLSPEAAQALLAFSQKHLNKTEEAK
jgi:hypothetical protein